MLVRGIYYEGWHPAGKPLKERKKEEFLGHIYKVFKDDLDVDCEQVACGVFQVLSKRVTAGEIHGVKQALPHEIRELWV